MKDSSSSRNTNLQSQLKVHVPKDYPWKVLDKLVDDLSDLLTESELQEVKTVIRKRDYSAYLALSQAWGPQSITSGGTTQTEMFAKYQIASLIKKFRFSGVQQERRAAAIEKFMEAEAACEEYNREGYINLACLEEEWALEAYTYARVFLERLLGVDLPDRTVLTHWSRHGPGANLDTKKRRVSLYDKYANWPYSCTKDALREARLSIEDDERWLGALEDDYRNRYSIPKHVILDRETFWANVLTIVPGNRITFVPKNSQIDRSIAIEP